MAAATFPVRLIYSDRATYAKGGLVNAALAVKRAGRYGDTEIIHINKAELAELKRQWGEPTINPETGMPEFFLGGLGKILKKALPIASIAANFIPIPGVAQLVSGGLGALNGVVNGGGLKGALLGAATGALGAGGTGSIASGIGKGILGAGASQVAKSALGNALTSGVIGGLGGHNVLQSALTGGATGAMQGMMAGTPKTAGAPAPAAAGATPDFNPELTLPQTPQLSQAPLTGSLSNVAPAAAPVATAAAPAAAAATSPVAAATSPNFWNKNTFGNDGSFLSSLGIKNKHAIAAGALGLALAGGLGKSSGGGSMPTQDQFFGTTFSNANLPSANIGTGGSRQFNSRPMEDYEKAGYMPEYKYYTGMADGGPVKPRINASERGSDYGVTIPVGQGSLAVDALSGNMLPQRLALAVEHPIGRGRLSLTAGSDRGVVPNHFGARYTLPFNEGGDVKGVGDGRADTVDALLSDGEYVMDAETVSMLGNGSNKAGAKALDQLRVNLRKHKGTNMARGGLSAKAKQPSAYMRRAG